MAVVYRSSSYQSTRYVARSYDEAEDRDRSTSDEEPSRLVAFVTWWAKTSVGGVVQRALKHFAGASLLDRAVLAVAVGVPLGALVDFLVIHDVAVGASATPDRLGPLFGLPRLPVGLRLGVDLVSASPGWLGPTLLAGTAMALAAGGSGEGAEPGDALRRMALGLTLAWLVREVTEAWVAEFATDPASRVVGRLAGWCVAGGVGWLAGCLVGRFPAVRAVGTCATAVIASYGALLLLAALVALGGFVANGVDAMNQWVPLPGGSVTPATLVGGLVGWFGARGVDGGASWRGLALGACAGWLFGNTAAIAVDQLYAQVDVQTASSVVGWGFVVVVLGWTGGRVGRRGSWIRNSASIVAVVPFAVILSLGIWSGGASERGRLDHGLDVSRGAVTSGVLVVVWLLALFALAVACSSDVQQRLRTLGVIYCVYWAPMTTLLLVKPPRSWFSDGEVSATWEDAGTAAVALFPLLFFFLYAAFLAAVQLGLQLVGSLGLRAARGAVVTIRTVGRAAHGAPRAWSRRRAAGGTADRGVHAASDAIKRSAAVGHLATAGRVARSGAATLSNAHSTARRWWWDICFWIAGYRRR